MYIGILNQKCSELQYTCTAKDRKTTPQMLCAGNPFAGETLSIGWAELRSEGIDLHTALPQEYYLCSAVLTLGETCAPRSVSLYTKDKSRLLYRYSYSIFHLISLPSTKKKPRGLRCKSSRLCNDTSL
jgi:hypothetical protein